MIFNNLDTRPLIKVLNTAARVSGLEIPAVIIGILALIPGIFDEMIFGFGAIGLLVGVILLRHSIKRSKDAIVDRLNEELRLHKIDETEHKNGIKALNILTVPGGDQS